MKKSRKKRSSFDKKELVAAFENKRQSVTREDTEELLARAEEVRTRAASCVGKWEALGRQVLLLWNMLRDWYGGSYSLPWRTVAAITAALLYFLNPFDLVPDLIPVLGLADDAAVMSLCIALIKADLRDYAEANGIDLEDCGL